VKARHLGPRPDEIGPRDAGRGLLDRADPDGRGRPGEGPKAFEALARRMDAVAGLRVTLLLNIQRRRGDTTAAEHLVRRFADRFWTTDWPGVARPRVYYDPRALDLDGPGGVLHAKAVVADDEAVFVTSANLTEAALDRNIEIGLLVRDRALAASVASHFRGLIDRELLRPLPAA
jgi:phosphatidylserine/phosphatidylglycerophosphate/cardiolipin synthase-like enzyme